MNDENCALGVSWHASWLLQSCSDDGPGSAWPCSNRPWSYVGYRDDDSCERTPLRFRKPLIVWAKVSRNDPQWLQLRSFAAAWTSFCTQSRDIFISRIDCENEWTAMSEEWLAYLQEKKTFVLRRYDTAKDGVEHRVGRRTARIC